MTLVEPGPTHTRAAPPAGRHRRLDDVGFPLVLAGLLLSCFAGHWSAIGVPVPLDRGLLALGLLLEWDRARRAGSLPHLSTAVVLLAAAAAWTGVSYLAGPDRGVDGLLLMIDLAVMPVVLFASAPVLFATAARRTAFAAAFAVFGIYLGATAIAEALHLTWAVVPGYIADASVGIHADRARGPYAEAVANGIMLVFSGVLGGWLALNAASARWRRVGAAAAVLAAVGGALTLTRAIWIAGVAVLLIALVVVPALRRRAPLVLGALLAGVGVFLLAFPGFLAAATDRGGSQGPVWDRLNVNAGAVRMVVAEPLTGVGWGQAGERMAAFVRLGADYPVTAASAGLIPHNVFLSRFAELGVLGASLWLAATVAALVLPVLRSARPGFGGWRVVLLCTAAGWIVVANFGPANYSEPVYLLHLIGGLVVAGAARPAAPFDWRPRRGGGVHRG